MYVYVCIYTVDRSTCKERINCQIVKHVCSCLSVCVCVHVHIYEGTYVLSPCAQPESSRSVLVHPRGTLEEAMCNNCCWGYTCPIYSLISDI